LPKSARFWAKNWAKKKVGKTAVNPCARLHQAIQVFLRESEADNEKLAKGHFYNHLLDSIIEISAPFDLIIHNGFLLR
jgi:hypothetical protein